MEDWMNSMRNDVAYNTAVSVITKDGEVWNGYESDKEWVKKHLKIGEIYHVEGTEVHDWNTIVYLKEFPGIPFNSVNLKEV